MSNFDKKVPRPEPFSTAKTVDEDEIESGVLNKQGLDGTEGSGPPAESGARQRDSMGSSPFLEIGDPITYDPTMEDTYDGVLPGDLIVKASGDAHDRRQRGHTQSNAEDRERRPYRNARSLLGAEIAECELERVAHRESACSQEQQGRNTYPPQSPPK